MLLKLRTRSERCNLWVGNAFSRITKAPNQTELTSILSRNERHREHFNRLGLFDTLLGKINLLHVSKGAFDVIWFEIVVARSLVVPSSNVHPWIQLWARWNCAAGKISAMQSCLVKEIFSSVTGNSSKLQTKQLCQLITEITFSNSVPSHPLLQICLDVLSNQWTSGT